MVAVVILSLSFTLSCGEEPIPSAVSDVGPGLREAWEEMCALDLDRALVAYFGAIRSVISVSSAHPFRFIPISDFGHVHVSVSE